MPICPGKKHLVGDLLIKRKMTAKIHCDSAEVDWFQFGFCERTDVYGSV